MSAVLTQIERGVAMEKDLSISNFTEIVNIIETAKNNAYKKVNEELIKMYWKIGGYLHNQSSNAEFGDAYVDAISEEIVRNFPGIKGFSRRGLYRMKQFYELYENDEFVSALLTQISWTNHLAIMSKAKKVEERHFYIALCAKEQYSSRELERQIESGYYERYMLSKEKLLPETIEKLQINPFLDTYVMEFLDLPDKFLERDLRKGLIRNMKSFILEVGKDFTFIDEEYKVMVGNSDFFIDLLFYHRGLQCLVAFELKVGKFKPEYISKMDFYLEALDRQIKKENENPSVGLILCASKDDEVVEYAMSRSMSPMMMTSIISINRFLRDKKRNNIPHKVKIKKALRANKLSSEFLLAYILPMIAFDFAEFKSVVLFIIYFGMLAFLCIRNSNVYTNIWLEIKGYRMYLCDLEANIMDRPHIYEECLVISKNNLTIKIENDIECWDFDNYIYIDLR